MANDPFKALAHPIRRGVIERLAQGPATVGEATQVFDVSKPTLSKHLRVLEEAGLITRVIDGREHRLALAVEPLREAGAGSAYSTPSRATWRTERERTRRAAERDHPDREDVPRRGARRV